MGHALSRHFPLIGNGEGERFPTLFLLLPMATVPALPLHSPPQPQVPQAALDSVELAQGLSKI